MARNRGKRPGAASGSTSPSQRQLEEGPPKAKDAPSADKTSGETRSTAAGGADAPGTRAAASHAIAAKIDPPSASAPSGGPAAGAAAKGPDRQPDEAAGSIGSAGGKAGAALSPTAGESAKPAAAGKATAPAASAAPTAATPTTPASTRPSATSTSSTSTTSAQGGGGGGGFWPGLIGGAIGGAAAAFILSTYLGGGDGDATAALESRLGAAEQQVSQLVQQQSGDMDALAARVAAIEAAPAAEAGGAEAGARLDDLEARLAALGEDSGLGEEIAALRQQLEAMSGLDQRIDSLGGQLQAATDAQQSSADVLDSLQGALPTLEETLAATGLAVEQASQQTAALGQTVESLSGDVQALAGRLEQAEGTLDHLGGAYQRGAAMIVAIGDVERAIARAEPYESAMQTLSSLVRDDAVLGETVATLEPMAADGVPSLAALKESYGAMASRALLAEEGDQSLADQVGNNVFGIINMRPAGADAEGSGSRAVLARAQSALSADDLAGAVSELDALEGAAAAEASSWLGRARGRLAAQAAVGELRAHAQSLVAEGS